MFETHQTENTLYHVISQIYHGLYPHIYSISPITMFSPTETTGCTQKSEIYNFTIYISILKKT